MPCFSGPRIERDVIHDRYSRDIFRITEYKNDPISSDVAANTTNYSTTKRQIEFNEIKNGLFIVSMAVKSEIKEGPRNASTELEFGPSDGNTELMATGIIICYNIYHTIRQDTSEIRLLEIAGMYEYAINNTENRIEITGLQNVETLNQGGNPDYTVARIRLVFEFDASGRISRYTKLSQINNELLEEYAFLYNPERRLEGIYSVHEWGNVLRKSIYYDGQLRILERPFFNNLNKINLDEIIVLDNDKIKYHSKRYRYYGLGRPILSDDFLTNDRYHFSYLIEFNECGDQIRQVNISNNTRIDYDVEYLRYDSKRNWILKRIGKVGYKREIEYMQ